MWKQLEKRLLRQVLRRAVETGNVGVGEFGRGLVSKGLLLAMATRVVVGSAVRTTQDGRMRNRWSAQRTLQPLHITAS